MIRRLVGIPALALTGLALAAAHAPAADPPALYGRVGPTVGEITMLDATGELVDTLDPGTYTVHVADTSAEDNFHLFGPGVDEATGVAAVGTATWTVTLLDGVYTVRSDAHTWMRFVLPVGNGQIGSTESSDPIAPLVGRVGPGRTISLRHPNGTLAKRLRHGDYRIHVHDRSSQDNFHLLAGSGLSLATGVGYVGDAEWVVRLVPGKFSYRSDPHRKTLQRTVVVT